MSGFCVFAWLPPNDVLSEGHYKTLGQLDSVTLKICDFEDMCKNTDRKNVE